MMAALLKLCFVALCIAATSAIPSYLYPVEHRNFEPVAVYPQITPQYEYKLVPSNEYAVAEYSNPTDLSLWELVPRIRTGLVIVLKSAWAVTQWVVAKGSLILLGVALMLGFCAFTPFCTITFEKHSFFGQHYRNIVESGALNQVEEFVYSAIDKFKSYQNDNLN